MAQWFVKDLSRLTSVSVQTLHHYDRIGLLKPSARLANGYRVYGEGDLLCLQQIVALKFFGFELSQIKALLKDQGKAVQQLLDQSAFLEKKAQRLLEASQTLKSIIGTHDHNHSLPWHDLINAIEVYQMTQKLEHSWVKDIFSSHELKEYAAFETQWMRTSTPEQRLSFETNWKKLITDIEKSLAQDPDSDVGIEISKRCMALINGVYGQKYAYLRTKKFEEGFGEGKGLEEVGLTPQTVAWLEKAVDRYWRDRLYTILDQVDMMTQDRLQQMWDSALTDMYGDDLQRKNSLYALILADEKVSEAVKRWLENYPR